MKPRNFPARKLARKAKAEGWQPSSGTIQAARNIRTKKDRRFHPPRLPVR